MKKTNKKRRIKRSLFSFENFIVFFVSAAIMHTFNIIMFIKLNNIEITYDDSKFAAISTAGNVIFLTLFFSIFDNVRKKYQIKKPVSRIIEATKKLTDGDFSARIQPVHKKEKNEFDVIIDDFNKMAQELSGVETLRKDFISNVSHELKTPLAVIQNYATMLQDPELDENQRIEYAKTVTVTSQRLSSLVTNILKLNKLENQQIYPNIIEYNVCEQLRECILDLEQFWEKKNISVEVNFDDEHIVKADKELMYLVWRNLISNAVKFTPENGKISIKTKATQNSVWIDITDTGCGISDSEMLHIFDKFYQGDTSHAMAGNGLGLALVKRIIDIMRGGIIVDSTIGEGSTFTIRLNNFYF